MSAPAPLPDSPSLRERVDQLRSQLDVFRRRLATGDAPDSPGFVAAMSEFLDFVVTYRDSEAYVALELAGSVGEYRSFFGPRLLEFTWLTERRVHHQLISRHDLTSAALGAMLEANAWGAYAGFGRMLALADLTTRRSFLMVGCGPLPDTLLYMHDRTSIETLVGVERDADAQRMARELVERFDRRRIEIRKADGAEVDYSAFDVICCSVFAAPRSQIIERIARTARDDCLVLFRDPVFTGTLLFESILDGLPARLEVLAKSGARPPGPFMLRYFVLGRGRTAGG